MTLLGLIVAGAVGLLLAFVATRRLVEPLTRLTEATRAIASRDAGSSTPTVAASRDAWRGWSWLDSTAVGQRSAPNARSRLRSAAANARADHGRVSSSQSKTR